MAAPRTITAPQEKGKIPEEIIFLIDRLKSLWKPLLYYSKESVHESKKELVIKSKADIKTFGLNEKEGTKARKGEIDKYEKYACFILDYIVFNFVDEFKNIFQSGSKDAGATTANVFKKFNDEKIFKMEKYLDANSAPHVYGDKDVSFSLYIRIRLYKEFMEKIAEYSDKAVNIFLANPKEGITPFGRACLRVLFLNHYVQEDLNIIYSESKVVWTYVNLKNFLKNKTKDSRLPGMEKHLAEYKHRELAEAKYNDYLKDKFDCKAEEIFLSIADRNGTENAPQKNISVAEHHATLYGKSGPSTKDVSEEIETKENNITEPTPSGYTI